eukprot:TRINITY_DN1478_c0_g1_i3.p1 TRINITY_DN1478_c0_g1~~TRINITY_DN1478_c0_g1_i3.p1  ORF type:complete len:220 (+),score=29.26 TRINITY_DN1478_c0_g1_i3:65-724(+)
MCIRDRGNYLYNETGFRLKPVIGAISYREFLYCFAHKVFCVALFLRHPKSDIYGFQVDLIHEVIGHAPLFADPDFADLLQEIGWQSLGTGQGKLTRLAALYSLIVETGFVKENGQFKSIGGIINASPNDMQEIIAGKDRYEPMPKLKQIPATKELSFASIHKDIQYYIEDPKQVIESLRNDQDYPSSFKLFYDSERKIIDADRHLVTDKMIKGEQFKFD